MLAVPFSISPLPARVGARFPAVRITPKRSSLLNRHRYTTTLLLASKLTTLTLPLFCITTFAEQDIPDLVSEDIKNSCPADHIDNSPRQDNSSCSHKTTTRASPMVKRGEPNFSPICDDDSERNDTASCSPPARKNSSKLKSTFNTTSEEKHARSSSPMKNNFYSLTPLAPHFGAEIHGVDLPKLMAQEQHQTGTTGGSSSSSSSSSSSPYTEFFTQVKEDLVKHRLLLFRKQFNFTGQQQVDFSKHLGKIESTFHKHEKSPHSDIFRVSNDEAEGCTNVGRSGWHVDGTFMETPFQYQTMYFESVAEGGDTLFMPLKEFYEQQTTDCRNRWSTLWMVTGRRQAPVHPLVYQHPHRKDTTMLFHCGEPFCSGWLRDDVDQNRGQERLLHPRIVQKELTEKLQKAMEENIGLAMKWQKGDFAINDNLGLAHYATEGTQGDPRRAGLRILHRTTVVGGEETIPRKADGRRSFFP
ncbi:unnamed protein product [Amoebophrya sp. A120]|nr:unnamed protein product [Amoebophrya sp. A120]|eukprot:GSA120T00025413001.1